MTDDKMTELIGENIPRPDPSTKTVEDIRIAIANLSLLVDAKMGGIQAVIAEQFKSIDKRLADRDTAINLTNASSKENVATALAAVIETGKSGNIRFDLLERRVAALELAISGQTGKDKQSSTIGTTIIQILSTGAAIIGAIIAYAVYSNVHNTH